MDTGIKIRKEAFGDSHYKYTVSNNVGTTMSLTNYGGTLLSVSTADSDGNFDEITLCYKDMESLSAKRGPYYGAIAGRVANRIKDGKFILDNKQYQLAINNGPNSLHGGTVGFDQRTWQARCVSAYIDADTAIYSNTTDFVGSTAGIEFRYVSLDGEEGYPGTIEVSVQYLLTQENDILITYNGSVTGMATPVNLTNHTYWNLSGGYRSKIYDHCLYLSCSRYLPTSETQIPLGELRPVKNTPFDFTFSAGTPLRRALIEIGKEEAQKGVGRCGLDHCFVVDGALSNEGEFVYNSIEQSAVELPVAVADIGDNVDKCQGAGNLISAVGKSIEQCKSRGKYLRHIATLTDHSSGRQMTVHGTQPGVQVYSANWLSDDSEEDSMKSEQWPHVMHNAICLETQHFPDAINQQASNHHFPTVVVRPGENYFHQAVFSFRTI